MSTATRNNPTVEETRRRASFIPATLDEEARTVEVVAATETPVQRWYGQEILRISQDAIDMTRIGQLPLLDSHDRSTVGAILGRVERVRVDGKKLIATVKFADTEAGKNAMALVGQGMIRAVSVGYSFTIDDTTETKNDGQTVRTVERWQPFELSLVSVPADQNATIRGRSEMDPEDIENIETIDNPPRQERREREVSARAARQIEQIRNMALDQGINEDLVDEAIEGARSADAARAALFDLLADRSRKTQTRANGDAINFSSSADNALREQAIEALAVRLGMPAPQNANNPMLGRPAIEIGRAYFERSGASARELDDSRVIAAMLSERSGFGFAARGGMHTTSDFPYLLMEAGNRTLQARFQALPSAIKSISVKRNARDFRQQSFIRPGEAPKLEKVGEAGEIKSGTLSEEKQGLQLATYGKRFTLSRQAIINDDLGAFSDFIGAFAEAAVTTEGDLLFDLLSQNAYGGVKLSDGKDLFHADHGNLAEAGAQLSVTSLSDARAAMRSQKNVNGTGVAGTVPSVILVGPAMETFAEQVVTELRATAVGDVNPFAGKLRVLVEDRYDGNGWWLFADPTVRPALAYAYLDGEEGPKIESQDGWEVLGRDFRCYEDFGCGVYDWRAVYFNPGA